jgi:hypothetical protein
MTRRDLASLALAMTLALCAGTLSSPRAADQPGPERAAQQAAESWLRLIDSGQYGPSWDSAARFFKGAVTKEQWINAITAVRGPLGPVKSRELKNTTHTKTLPGAPDGDYVILQYGTSFEKKQSAIETITPTLDPDGQWRVSGYFIR